MAFKLRNRFLYLVTERERKLGRKIKYVEIAEATGISQGVISRWMNTNIERYDAPVVEKLCEYFECDLCELLYLEHLDGSPN
ncbi:MAG: helix-turn-helix transcriptional regulator [Anaerolineae bacterium]